jgi:hypothetical protein
MAGPLTMLRPVLTPFRSLVASRPVLAISQANLRCNSAYGYCDLPLNVGRHEMTREEIQLVFPVIYRDARSLRGWTVNPS